MLRSGRYTMPFLHGLATTYNNHGCRCPECTKASTAAQYAWRHRTGFTKLTREEYLAQAKTIFPIKHGTESGYTRCRKEEGGACAECREAARVARQQRRQRNKVNWQKQR